MKRRDFLRTGSTFLGASVLGLAANAQGSSMKQPISAINPSDNIRGVRFDINNEDTIFIFADLHEGLIQTSKTLSPDSLAANAGGLAKAAAAVKAPAIFLTVPQNGKEGIPIPQILPYADKKNTFFRVNADPFQVSEISSALDNLKRKTLIVCGYTAEVAVLLTALGGLCNGYKVFIPVDCTGSRSARTETVALHQAEQAGAVLTSLTTLAAQMGPDFSSEPGRTMLSVISNVRS